MTRILTCPPEGPSTALLQTVTSALRAGQIVILPTDTVYGVAAGMHSADAVKRLLQIKGRPAGKPLALLAADTRQVMAMAKLDAAGQALAGRFWPGPLTLVLRRGDVWEGFRVPNHPVTHPILQTAGTPLRVTSPNRRGAAPALNAAEAVTALNGAADLAVDAGPAPGGQASTVLAMEPGRPRILRDGPVTAAEIEAVLGNLKIDGGRQAPACYNDA